MGTETGAGHEERLLHALERLIEIQKSIQELNREARRIRTHIEDFDVNVDALNLLAQARSKDGHSGGVQVLEDLIRYARQTGTQVGACEGDGAFRVPDVAVVHPSSEVEKRIEHQHPEERASAGLWRFLAQLALAVAMTSGLFALVH